MADVRIVDYTSLKNALKDWLYRGLDTSTGAIGQSVDDQMAQLVSQGEARIRRNQEWFVRLFSLTNNGAPLVISANPTTLPPMTQLRSIWAATSLYKHDIEIITPETWGDLKATNLDTPGIPQKAVIVYDAFNWMGTTPQVGPSLYLWPNPVGALKGDSGTATGTQSANTLQDTSKTWSVNQWAGGSVQILTGPGTGQTATILSNTTNTLALASNWTTIPVSGQSGYSINNAFLVDFEFLADVPTLANQSTNALLTRHPDLYLYACLAEAQVYYQADERLQVMEGKYQQIVKEINIERERAQFGAAAKRPRLPRVF